MNEIKLQRYKSVFEKLHEKINLEKNGEIFSMPCRTSEVINQLIKYIYEYLKGNITINEIGIS